MSPIGVALLSPHRFGDQRGWFSETWNHAVLEEADFRCDFIQDNYPFSAEPATLRRLHYQAPPHAQEKLVRG